LPEPQTNQNPARESISTIKNNMASLELNFVTFQQEVIKSFEDLKNEKRKTQILLSSSLKKQITIEKKLKNITTQLEENHGKNTKQHDSESSSMIIDASKNTETIRNTELHPQTNPDLPINCRYKHPSHILHPR
jgi:hypothetical protein